MTLGSAAQHISTHGSAAGLDRLAQLLRGSALALGSSNTTATSDPTSPPPPPRCCRGMPAFASSATAATQLRVSRCLHSPQRRRGFPDFSSHQHRHCGYPGLRLVDDAADGVPAPASSLTPPRTLFPLPAPPPAADSPGHHLLPQRFHTAGVVGTRLRCSQ
ncbi:hypothetical protein BS78_08G087900 [Paspalum vaginatum]|nr:hypothetical protein BS78_08G087900 [Paspalum vaginatum]